MSSIQESTHATFLANFKKLVNRCRNNQNYNPGNPDISASNLAIALAEAEGLAQTLVTAESRLQRTANDRRDLFAPLSTFASNLVNDFASFNVTKKAIKDAHRFVKNITGQSSKISTPTTNTTTPNTTTPTTNTTTPNTTTTPTTNTTTPNTTSTPTTNTTTNTPDTNTATTTPDATTTTPTTNTTTPNTTTTTTTNTTTPPKKSRSTSNRSYVELAEHLNKLASYLFNDLINGRPQTYNPTKFEYQYPQLENFVGKLRDANEDCDSAQEDCDNARTARNDKFYSNDPASIYSLATRVKKYIRGQFPPDSPIALFASPLPFVRP